MHATRLLIAMFLGATVAVAPLRSGADPAERVSTTADRERVDLTIYNGGTSLVHDRRRVTLASGVDSIAWRDVSGVMDAPSAILDDRTAVGATTVLEQNFDYDLLKPSTLLDKYVGREVTIVHDRPVAGRPGSETATLLADNEGVVLKYRDRIETGLYDAHIVFPTLPGNLRDRPTLVLDVASAKGGAHDLDLSYLTGGLGWQADYVGILSDDERRMDAYGLVTLTNTTGTTYADAHLRLVAGNVNVVEPTPQTLRTIGAVRTRQSPQQENFFEYHLYTLERPTTVANAQTKQVALLAAKGVPVRKTLELRGDQTYYTNQDADLGRDLSVGAYLTFVNHGGDLGVPLPGGIFRLYEHDRSGLSQFLGSDRIDHTPRDRAVRLHLGDSFDVKANRKQTDFHIVTNCTDESSYAIDVSNAKDVAQDVLVVEPIPGDWSIVRENLPHEKTSSGTATWTLHVPSRKTLTLDYTARVRYCV